MIAVYIREQAISLLFCDDKSKCPYIYEDEVLDLIEHHIIKKCLLSNEDTVSLDIATHNNYVNNNNNNNNEDEFYNQTSLVTSDSTEIMEVIDKDNNTYIDFISIYKSIDIYDRMELVHQSNMNLNNNNVSFIYNIPMHESLHAPTYITLIENIYI